MGITVIETKFSQEIVAVSSSTGSPRLWLEDGIQIQICRDVKSRDVNVVDPLVFVQSLTLVLLLILVRRRRRRLKTIDKLRQTFNQNEILYGKGCTNCFFFSIER